ncbi:RBBP9/YdeN family alpha/beta hydrolase [Taklimakanibacter deserti]|uniref:RBBP9/YdeN family alpha/beta hydrolase n=1 Tax=Taklimakanibacter deserti TaxID=2267839 RepID=UPI000E65B210
MTEFIVLPGIGGSGDSHWQTFWERANPAMRRFAPANWEAPDFKNWMAALELAVATARTPPLLIAHSLSCLLVAHWQKVSRLPVKGAFLAAVPDPSSPVFPTNVDGFVTAPRERFRFPSLIVASANDPYGSLDYAKARAVQWGCQLHIAGALGHINGASNLGEWADGKALLEAFTAACP